MNDHRDWFEGEWWEEDWPREAWFFLVPVLGALLGLVGMLVLR